MPQLLRSFKEAKRYWSVVLLLCTLLPVAIITSYANLAGRYIGLVGFSLAAMLGLYEVYRTMGIHKYLAIAMTLVVVPFMLLNFEDFQSLVAYTYVDSSLRTRWALRGWPIYLIVLLVTLMPFAIDLRYRQQRNFALNGVINYLVTLVALVFIKLIWTLAMKEFWLFAYFVLIAVLSDSVAYLSGRFLGHRKFTLLPNQPKRNYWRKKIQALCDLPLARTISPRKTLIGFLIAFIVTALFAILAGYYTKVWNGTNPLLVSIVGGLFLAAAAPLGDLAFSAIKRFRGVKDFSNLIPGHGGVFDRFDALSLTCVMAALIFVST